MPDPALAQMSTKDLEARVTKLKQDYMSETFSAISDDEDSGIMSGCLPKKEKSWGLGTQLALTDAMNELRKRPDADPALLKSGLFGPPPSPAAGAGTDVQGKPPGEVKPEITFDAPDVSGGGAQPDAPATPLPLTLPKGFAIDEGRQVDDCAQATSWVADATANLDLTQAYLDQLQHDWDPPAAGPPLSSAPDYIQRQHHEEEARAEGLRDAAQRALNNAKATKERLCPEESSIFRPWVLVPVAIVGVLLVGGVTQLVFHPISFSNSQSAGSSGGQGSGGNQANKKPSDPAQFFKSAFGASDNWQVISLRRKEMITVNGKTNETNGDETDSKNPLFVYGSNTVGTQVFKYFRRGSNGDSCTTSAAGKLFFFPGSAPVPADAFDPYGILPKITAQKLEPDGPAPAGLGVDGTFWKGIGEYPLPEGLPTEHKIMNHTFEIYLDPATLQVKVMVQDTTATDTSNGQSQQTHDVVNFYGFNPNAVANPPDCKKQ